MSDQETRRDRLEAFLMDYKDGAGDFSTPEYAEVEGMDSSDASADVQAYLAWQRMKDPEPAPLYVLRRVGRTTAARWSIGERVSDARLIDKEFGEDVKVKVLRALIPDLNAIARKNPNAKRAIGQMEAAIDGAMKVLAIAAGNMWDELDSE